LGETYFTPPALQEQAYVVLTRGAPIEDGQQFFTIDGS